MRETGGPRTRREEGRTRAARAACSWTFWSQLCTTKIAACEAATNRFRPFNRDNGRPRVYGTNFHRRLRWSREWIKVGERLLYLSVSLGNTVWLPGVVDEDLVSWMVAWILRYRFLPCHFFVQREYFYHLLEDVNSQFSWNIESLYFII